MFGADELEQYADKKREKAFERLKAVYLAERHSFERMSSSNLHGVQLPHQTATLCLALARHRIQYENKYDWDYAEDKKFDHETLRVVTIKRGPLTFIARIISDNDGMMLDDLGTVTFCNYGDWENRAEFRPSHEAIWVDFGQNSDSQGWLEAEYSYDERRKDYEKLGRQNAHEAARLMLRRDAKRFEDFYKENWQYIGVKVEAFIGDIELGDEALWGIDWDGKDYSYINEIVDERISELYYSALDYIETQAKGQIDKFAELIKGAELLLTVNRAERNEWLEKLMDYTVEVAGELPRPDDVNGWGQKD
jgi:hypothetical protein